MENNNIESSSLYEDVVEIYKEVEINDNLYEDKFGILDKKQTLKLNYWYKLIQKIPNYKEQEDNMYSKVGADSISKKIAFELKRIYKKIRDLDEDKAMSMLEYLAEYYQFALKQEALGSEKIEHYYYELTRLIIEFEMYLDMKIGLYDEFVKYYEEKMNSESRSILLNKKSN